MVPVEILAWFLLESWNSDLKPEISPAPPAAAVKCATPHITLKTRLGSQQTPNDISIRTKRLVLALLDVFLFSQFGLRCPTPVNQKHTGQDGACPINTLHKSIKRAMGDKGMQNHLSPASKRAMGHGRLTNEGIYKNQNYPSRAMAKKGDKGRQNRIISIQKSHGRQREEKGQKSCWFLCKNGEFLTAKLFT